MIRALTGLAIGVLISGASLAQDADSEPMRSTSALSTGDIITVMVGLLVVVGLIFASAWIVRRFNGGTTANSRVIKVLAVTPLGAKEKLVLAAVGEQQILLGVTPQSITRLAELSEPIDLEAHPEGSPFARQLGALIGGKQSNSSSGRRPGS